MKKLKQNAICYGAYLCVFVVVAVLARRYLWDLSFPLLFFGGATLLSSASRFTSYYDRFPDGEDAPHPALKILLRWSPLLFGVLTAAPPLIFVLLS